MICQRIATFVIGLGLFANTQAQAPFWLDEQKNEENRMPMHADFFSFESETLAKTGKWQQSANYQSLNGDWKFKWAAKPAELPAGFEAVGFDDSQWKNFKVPATAK